MTGSGLSAPESFDFTRKRWAEKSGQEQEDIATMLGTPALAVLPRSNETSRPRHARTGPESTWDTSWEEGCAHTARQVSLSALCAMMRTRPGERAAVH